MKNQVKDAFNALECFTTISVALENSNQELLMENGEEPMPTRNRRPKNPKLGKLFIEEEEQVCILEFYWKILHFQELKLI